MPNHAAVNPVDHKTIRISGERSEAAGDGQMCCITFPNEFRSVQSHYPILFQKEQDREDYRCLALFGFENGENLFLKNGTWDARYIPLAMDVQPFMIGLPKDGASDRKVVIDLDNPRVGESNGTRLFDENGVATEFLEGVSHKLNALDIGYQRASGFTAALQHHGLLEPLMLDITLANGAENRLLGFHTIHEEALEELDAASLKDLQSEGFLQAIYMALASLSHLTELADRKNALITNAG